MWVTVKNTVKDRMNTVEFTLYGSVLDSAYTVLIERLRGLADPKFEKFHEHELVFANKNVKAGVVNWHVRRSLDQPNAPYHVKYMGDSEADLNEKCPVNVRKVINCLCTSNDMMAFLGDIGFRMQYEFVAKGILFKKGPIKVTVSKIYRVIEAGNSSAVEKFTDSHLVEMSALSSLPEDPIANTIREFADQLKPIVNMEKIINKK
ncbi:Mediator of RNA polymerase II transcription subunit 18 [Trichinella nelsoni]|uniref:Mediator of RNA polymerase II transcription subunit 18 n=1 Tax=Trichinella nelsoni TaxID=6336 RepID=A0A0V0SLS2_9BILA|nr:Mediator of RNA polymerase II transcription subunit 18 [Trichinella nelsoni]